MANKPPGLRVLTVALLLAPSAAFPQIQSDVAPRQSYWPGPWHMWSGDYGWPAAWWICPLMMLFMVLVAASAFFFIRRRRGDGRHGWGPFARLSGGRDQAALQTLSERFARGEIQEDEYMQRKLAILSGGAD
jgi:putative membrane protein